MRLAILLQDRQQFGLLNSDSLHLIFSEHIARRINSEFSELVGLADSFNSQTAL